MEGAVGNDFNSHKKSILFVTSVLVAGFSEAGELRKIN
jgi:hypothetical protein